MKHWKKKPWVDSEVRNWDYIADHIAPDATSADAGKVLTVGETGKPEWGEGGGSDALVQDFILNYDPENYIFNITFFNANKLVDFLEEHLINKPYSLFNSVIYLKDVDEEHEPGPVWGALLPEAVGGTAYNRFADILGQAFNLTFDYLYGQENIMFIIINLDDDMRLNATISRDQIVDDKFYFDVNDMDD